jgi:hypothetical protein
MEGRRDPVSAQERACGNALVT